MFDLLIKKGQLDTLKKEIKSLSVVNNKVPSIVKVYDKELNSWERELIGKLSDFLPEKYWHSLRDASRQFPYKNTGELVNSIKSKTDFIKNKNFAYVHSWVEIGVPYAVDLNEGIPPRSDNALPKWKGFANDLFYNHNGRQGLKSVLDLFDELIENLTLKVA